MWEFFSREIGQMTSKIQTAVEAKIKKINRLRDELAREESEFESMFKSKSPVSRKKATTKKAKAGKKKAPAAGKKNDMPLTKMIPNAILEGYKENGATHPQILEDVLKRGYQHSSKDFGGVVYQTLRKLVRNGELGEIEPAKEGEKPKYVLPKFVEAE